MVGDVPGAARWKEQETVPIHKAQAAWRGTFRDGEGEMKLGSGAFEGAYSYRSRMEDSVPGTNPEELLGAAHPGCFSMSLARRLSADGYAPERIHTEARVRLGRAGEGGYAIDRIELRTEAETVISRIEHGLVQPRAKTLRRLAEALGVAVEKRTGAEELLYSGGPVFAASAPKDADTKETRERPLLDEPLAGEAVSQDRGER